MADACSACAAGTFKEASGNDALDCLDCKDFSESLAGKISATGCLCVQGYAAAGFFYVGASQTCEACPAGSFCLGTLAGGALATTTATPCPTNSVSDAGAESQAACACKPGYSGANTVCVLCLAGSFKSAAGPGPCDPCQSNVTSGAGSTAAAECLCNAGFTEYNNETNAQCVRCAPNTFKDTLGGGLCQNCTAFSTSPAGSVAAAACVCDLGYSPASGACAPCRAGSYGGTAMDALLKRNVPFITSLATDWNELTQKFDSKCAGQTCAGNTGGMSAGTVTTGTVDGHGAGASVTFVGGTTQTRMQWGANSIPAIFTICSVTRYSGEVKERILSANGNPEGSLNWMHGHGHSSAAGAIFYNSMTTKVENSITPKTDWLVACGRNLVKAGAAGVYMNGVKRLDAVGGEGSCAMAINPPQTTQWSDWQLSKVYIWNYLLSDNDFLLASQALNSEKAETMLLDPGCSACPPHSTSPPASTSIAACACAPGFSGVPGACVACPAGSFKASAGNASCVACNSNATSLAASTHALNCSCVPGYSGPACSVCQAGSFKTGAGPGTCQTCPADSISPAASPNGSMCECNAGFSGANDGACAACPFDTFQTTLGSAPCVTPLCAADEYRATQACWACPLGMTSPPGSPSRDDCVCRPDQIRDSVLLVCKYCQPGTFRFNST